MESQFGGTGREWNDDYKWISYACSSLSAMLELKSWGRSLLLTLAVIWMRYMVFICI